MSRQSERFDLRMTRAVAELQTLIRRRYPDAQFEVVRDVDDPAAVHLATTVDIEEPEDVVDLVIERLLQLQVEETLPIHVIPLLPFERLAVQEEPSLSNPSALLGHTPQA